MNHLISTLKCILIIILFQVSMTAQSFITTWNTSNPGTSNNTSITIPTGTGAFNYDVDWNNDGVFDQLGLAAGVTHNFGVAGIYTIRIRGNFPSIYFNNGGDKLKIIDIKAWGTISWSSMKGAFHGCTNLTCTATDAPVLTNVSDMSSIFRASGITGNFSVWNVSSVTDMSFAFSYATSFNSNINAWNMGNVTTMRGMFWGASKFNQPLNSWNVVKVTDMSFMFSFAESFNQPLNAWNVFKAGNMA
ncbi:MAG: BspA family leucine-rich repeat surface protein, partial [Saprospiraceae bacterium]